MDYSHIGHLVHDLTEQYSDNGISLSLPSLRMDAFSVEIAKEVQKVRKGTLTLAPEAGSQRMRDIINKNISEDDIVNTAAEAFQNGFRSLKFYMMIGLPFEEQEDIEGIKDLIHEVKTATGKGLNLSVSVGTLCPKRKHRFNGAARNLKKLFVKTTRIKSMGKNSKGCAAQLSRF